MAAVKIERFRDDELADIALEMAVMAEAGMPFHRIVDSVASGQRGQRGDMLRTSAGMLVSGKTSPEDALAVSGLFPEHFLAMLGAGNATGKAPEALSALHGYYLRSWRIRSKIRDAAWQPLGMLAVSLCVFLIMITKVLPVFSEAYQSAGMALDGITASLLAFGRSVTGHWILYAAGCGLLMAAVWALSRTGKAREALSRMAAGTRAGQAVLDARFLQALSMGLDSGMDAYEASAIACDVAGGGRRFLKCMGMARDGAPLSAVLSECGILPESKRHVVLSGEASGSLPDTVAYVAGAASDYAERRIDRLSGLVEPAVTVAGSVLTGGTIVLAMLPLLSVMQSIG